jgi:hypothetical protein
MPKYYYREEDWYPVYQLMPPNEVAPYIEMTEEEMHAYLTAKDTLALELQKFNKKLQKQKKEREQKIKEYHNRMYNRQEGVGGWWEGMS